MNSIEHAWLKAHSKLCDLDFLATQCVLDNQMIYAAAVEEKITTVKEIRGNLARAYLNTLLATRYPHLITNTFPPHV